MTVFLVTRHGVYIQGVVGVFSSNLLAKEAVRLARKAEPDHYHTFNITPQEMDNRYLLELED